MNETMQLRFIFLVFELINTLYMLYCVRIFISVIKIPKGGLLKAMRSIFNKFGNKSRQFSHKDVKTKTF